MSDDQTAANPAQPQAAPQHAQSAGPELQTEDLLNSLIAECREYVRLIGVHFDDPQTDPHIRWKFMEMVMDMVKTGAVVGDTVAKLRGGVAREIRQRIIVERSLSTARGEGGGGFPEND